MQGIFPHSVQGLDPIHRVSLSKQASDSEEVNRSLISSLLVAHTDLDTEKQAQECWAAESTRSEKQKQLILITVC